MNEKDEMKHYPSRKELNGLKYSTWDFHILIRDRGLFNSREEHIERYLDKPVESYKITKHDLLD